MYTSKLEGPLVSRLFEAILSLKTQEECYRFFDDVATIGEIQALAQRLQVAEMLNAGDKYADIAQHTGASTATISRVNKCLTYGADGYKTVLNRLK